MRKILIFRGAEVAGGTRDIFREAAKLNLLADAEK